MAGLEPTTPDLESIILPIITTSTPISRPAGLLVRRQVPLPSPCYDLTAIMNCEITSCTLNIIVLVPLVS